MPNDDAGPLRRMLYVSIVLTAFWLALCCSMQTPPKEDIRATVTEAKLGRTLTGDYRYFLELEYRDTAGVLNHQRLEVQEREWRLFGRQGAEICLSRFMGGWRMDPCR